MYVPRKFSLEGDKTQKKFQIEDKGNKNTLSSNQKIVMTSDNLYLIVF